MSVSGMLATAAAMPSTAIFRPKAALPYAGRGAAVGGWTGMRTGAGGGGLVVECSSRPRKKSTAHHMKTRPKKTQPWDVKRKGPTVYPPFPALPPDWALVSDTEEPAAVAAPEQQVEEGKAD